MSKKRKSNFKRQTAADANRRKKEASSYGYLKMPKGIKVLNIKDKTRSILLDFIPYEVSSSKHPDRYDPEEQAIPGTLWYKKPFKVHRNVGSENDTVVCPTSIKKKCPICEYVAKQLKSGADWNDMVELKAKDRNLYAVIPLDSDEHDEEIHIWDMSKFLFQNELDDQLEEDPDMGVFPDLEEGKTLEVKLKWKKFGKHSYYETRDIGFVDRDNQYDENILDDVPDLDTVLEIKSYDALHNLFFEMDDEDEATDTFEEGNEEQEEETKKPSRHRKPKQSKKEEDPEPEEEKEEEKKERTKTRTRRKKNEDNKCPHGHVFGKDCEEHNECDDCKEWDACYDEREKNE